MFRWFRPLLRPFSQTKQKQSKDERPIVTPMTQMDGKEDFILTVRNAYSELLQLEGLIVNNITDLSQKIEEQNASNPVYRQISDLILKYEHQVRELQKRRLQLGIYKKQIDQLKCWDGLPIHDPNIFDESLKTIEATVDAVKTSIGFSGKQP
jgi:hypothetical protein